MDHFAGLDVSVKETSICIVDDTGRIVREVKVASEPEALLPVFSNPAYHFKRIGLEAGPLSQWLFSGRRGRLAGDLCRDAAHAGSVKGADQQDGPQRRARHGADDAGGALPSGACEDVTQPKTANAADPSQAAAVEGHRHRQRPARHLAQLRSQGRDGRDGEVRGTPDLAELVEPLLVVRRVLRVQLGILHRRLLAIVRDDEVCRRLMTVPGVGPVV